jgi:hypothetical protein
MTFTKMTKLLSFFTLATPDIDGGNILDDKTDVKKRKSKEGGKNNK